MPRGTSEAQARSRASGSASPITHVVLIVQENRTFNNFFATFPGADGSTTGLAVPNSYCHIGSSGSVTLTKSPLIESRDLNHGYQGFNKARDRGKLDGFDVIPYSDGQPECMAPYQYVDPTQIQPYWDIAQQYTLAEHMFTTQGSSSFTGHQDLITGGTIVSPGEAMVNLPSCSSGSCRWGCDAPKGTHTSLISNKNVFQPGKGPFPCTNDFQSSYPTMRDLLDAASVSWKYYVPSPCCNTNGRLFTAYDIEYAVRYGPEWKKNISTPQTNIFNDISSGTLPAVSWLIPIEQDSDHPGEKTDDGPAWVASVVNAIGESGYWKNTAIVIVWDDWGGLYDNLNPKQVGYGGLGFRVPAMIVSAYAKAAYISKTYYDFGSILRYIEDNWSLGTLGGDDKSAQSIIDCFDYSQPPITFEPIPSQHSKSYFLHRRVPNLPPDSDM
ncbi:MAG TPA: alkaline phosphatase family protein [Candidatus Nitrosotalea sp.]|nr:alkaline phosphatase family protein [Candidatus Nitrosotalea sp.]